MNPSKTSVHKSPSEELTWEEKPTLTQQAIFTLSPTSGESGISAMNDILTGMVDTQTSKLSGISKNLWNVSPKKPNLSYLVNLLEESKEMLGEITSGTRIVLRNLSTLCSSTNPELVCALLVKLSLSQNFIFESVMKYTNLHSALLELENLRFSNGMPIYLDRNSHARDVKDCALTLTLTLTLKYIRKYNPNLKLAIYDQVYWEENDTLTALLTRMLYSTLDERFTNEVQQHLIGIHTTLMFKAQEICNMYAPTSEKMEITSNTENLLEEARRTIGEISSGTRLLLRNLCTICESGNREHLSVTLTRLSHSQIFISNVISRFTTLHSTLLSLERLTWSLSTLNCWDPADAKKEYLA